MRSLLMGHQPQLPEHLADIGKVSPCPLSSGAIGTFKTLHLPTISRNHR